MRNVVSTSREARAYYGSDAVNHVTCATALLVTSGISRALGNFFLGVTSPRVPTRLFGSEAEALEWLRGQRGPECASDEGSGSDG